MTTTALDQHDVAGLSSHLGPLGYDVARKPQRLPEPLPYTVLTAVK